MKTSRHLLVFSLFLLIVGCDNYTGIVSATPPIDSTPPFVSTPLNITVEATGTNGAAAVDAAIATFLSSGSASDAGGVSSFSHNAPTTFPLGTTTVTFSYTDNAGNTGTGTATVSVIDTTAPVINLNTANQLVITLGSTFTDPVTATDIADNNLTITTTGSVNGTVAGTYTLTYSVTDASGNTATATRTVIVNTPPSATSVTLNTHAGTSIAISMQGTDADAGTTLSLRVTALPANGTLYLTPNGTTLGNAVTTTASISAGSQVIYVPHTGFSGQDTFQFIANDAQIDSTAATVTVDVTNTAPVAGMNNGPALSFDGVDDSVVITNNTTLDAATGTWEFWVRSDGNWGVDGTSDGVNVQGAAVLMTRADAVSSANGLILVVIPSGKVVIQVKDGTTGVQTNNSLLTSTSVTDSVWHHVAMTYDETIGGGVKVYIDGILETSTTIASAWSFNGQDLLLANSTDPFWEQFQGQMDEVRIWNTARTQAEIQANMHAQLAGNETGLVGYWKLNEGTGTVANDSTLNGNNGSLGNGVAAAQPTWASSIGSPQVDPGTVNTPTNTHTTLYLGGTDADGDALSIRITNITALNGTLHQTTDGVTVGAAIAAGGLVNNNGQLIFVPTGGFSGSTAFDYVVNDGTVDSAAATITVNVVNTAPVAFTAIQSVDTRVNGIKIPIAANNLNFSSAADFTISMWVKPSALTESMALYSQETDTNGTQRLVFNSTATGAIKFNADNFSTGWDYITSSPVLAIGQWSYVTATRSGNTVTLYHNGTQVGQGTLSVSVNATAGVGPHYIGAFKDMNNGNDLHPVATAKISDVSVWDAALTQTQVANLMPTRLQGNETNLIAYWPLDEGTGILANDLVGNTNDGALLTGAVWSQQASPFSSIATPAGNNTAITLSGSDADGDALTVRITSLPTNGGSLFQADGTTAIAIGDTVTDANGQVVFNSTTVGNDSFKFVANDGIDDSATAMVTVNVMSSNTPPVAAAGTALQFDGVNDVIEIPDSASLDDTNNVTVELWFNSTQTVDNGPAGQVTLMEKGGPFSNYPYTLRMTPTNGIIIFATFDATNVPAFISSTTRDLNDGQWHHIAGVRNGNQSMSLYIDGQLEGEITSATNTALANLILPTNNRPLTFGNTTTGPFNPYQGKLDDMRVWNTVRTQAQIQANMNSTLAGNEAGLIGYWNFDEGTGTVAADGTANANNGTLGAGVAANVPVWTASANTAFNPGAFDTDGGVNKAIYLGGSDVDGDALSIRITNITALNGTLHQTTDGVTVGAAIAAGGLVNNNGQLIFVPTGGFSGSTAFDYVVNDGTVDSAAATITVNVLNTAPVAGMNNGPALSFDGVDDSVVIPNNTTLDAATGTWEFWVRSDGNWGVDGTSDGVNVKGTAVLMTRADAVSSANGLILTVIPSGKVGLQVKDGTTGVQTNSTLLTLTRVTDSVWHHVAMTYDETIGGGVKVYIDGILETSTTIASAWSFNGQDLLLANSTDPFWEQFQGQMDEVRIWNTARTQAEIQANMHAQLAGNETGLVGYWKLNEGTGSVANDSTINGNNGSLGNGVAAAQPTWITSAGSPQIDPGSVNTPTNTHTTLYLGGTDADGDALTFIRISGLPANGSLFQTTDGTTLGAAIALNDDVTHADGQIIYMPNNGFAGSDTVNFLVSDGFDPSTTATLTINIINTAPIAGTMDSALQFDGTNDYIRVPLVNAPTYTTQATAEYWFNSSSTGIQLSLQNIANLGTVIVQNRYTAGDVLFAFDSNTINESTSFGAGLNDGQWHHATGVHDNGTVSIYVDGQLVGTKTETLVTGLGFDGAIGINSLSLTSPTNGFLDDIRVWNTARTQAQIQANMRRPLTGTEPGLVGYWNLDEGSGTVANDSTANANNGTLGAGVVAQQPTWTLPASTPAKTVLTPTVAMNADAGVNRAIYLGGYDADGHALSIRVTSLPTNGSLFQADGATAIAIGDTVTDATGIVIFNSTTVGNDSFSFVANDGFDNSNTATVNINVIALPAA